MKLIFIHGTGGSPRVWDRVRNVVETPSDAVALSIGPSTTIADLAGDVLDDIGDDRAVLVGHSLGAMVAQEAAIARPDRVSGLVLCNSIPGATERVAELNEAMASALETVGIEPMLAPLHQALFPPAYADSEALSLFDEDAIAFGAPAFAHALRAIASWSSADRLGSVTAGSVVIAGALEGNVDEQRRLASLLRCPIEVLDGVAHMTPLERPDAIARAVNEIVAAV